MNREILSFAQSYLTALSIQYHMFTLPYDDTPFMFDLGLRSSLGQNSIYPHSIRQLLYHAPEKDLVFFSDIFSCSYCVLRFPTEPKKVLLAGPYCTAHISKQQQISLLKTLSLSSDTLNIFEQYYKVVPILDSNSFTTFMITLAEKLLPSAHIQAGFLSVPLEEKILHGSTVDATDTTINIDQIVKRYAIMDDILEAVLVGNTDKASSLVSKFLTAAPQRRFSNALLDTKKWLIIFNTSLRSTAQRAHVHPYYIDKISEQYSFRIEALTDPDTKSKMMVDMVLKYSELITRQISQNYPETIQKVFIYISNDLAGNLSLKYLADRLNINASYLSDLFKKEVGMSLTAYIHQQRIKKAENLLRNSKLNINEIAQSVGILDLSYFTKLFKKHTGQTPSEYRRLSTIDYTSF